MAITKNDILNIKVDDNKYEICKLSETPVIIEGKLSIYELPKNNILISSKLPERKYIGHGFCGCSYDIFKNKEIIFNFEKCKIIKILENDESEIIDLNLYKIIIYNQYICVSNNENIYIYNISNYDFIKIIKIGNNNNIYNYVYDFDENMLLIANNEKEFILTLYDITDINNIKYQKLHYDKIQIENYNVKNMMPFNKHLIDIKKFQKRK